MDKDKKLATSPFDFVDIDLSSKEKYRIKDMHYWLWSEKNQELQEYRLVEHFQRWEDLKIFVENKLCFILKEK